METKENTGWIVSGGVLFRRTGYTDIDVSELRYSPEGRPYWSGADIRTESGDILDLIPWNTGPVPKASEVAR